MKLPYEFIQIRKAYLKHMIHSLPTGVVKNVSINGKEYRSIYISKYGEHPELIRHRYNLSSKKGMELYSLIKKREAYQAELDKLNADEDQDLYDSIDFSSAFIHRNDENWKKIKSREDSNTKYPKPVNAPQYKGLLFRSKSEMTIAMVLDELGLEYVYESSIQVGNKTYYPDFAVFFRETGKIFFIEHFGRMGKYDYRRDNFEKFSTYMINGFKVGKEMLMFFETDDAGIVPDVFRQQIISILMVSINEVLDQRIKGDHIDEQTLLKS